MDVEVDVEDVEEVGDVDDGGPFERYSNYHGQETDDGRDEVRDYDPGHETRAAVDKGGERGDQCDCVTPTRYGLGLRTDV